MARINVKVLAGVGSVLLLAAGCASEQAVFNNYTRLVHTDNGVDAQEAKIIAQKQIVGMMEKRDYRVSVPDIRSSPEALKYPDYWFVTFGHNWFSPMSTDPMAKTYRELMETQYLVVINKKTGEVKFSGQWYPKRQSDFDWAFDPEGYKINHPLALPPGEKGHPLF